ncbi:metallophosphoesterase 1 homolog isoform X2 [Procambarus clarkii]|nr:metallophosphoesterase 1 homolog isoform X2 [Procambarus clarkii]
MFLRVSTCFPPRVTRNRFVVVFLTGVVLLNEWISYAFTATNWPIISNDSEDSVRVLIAADPQILSIQSEPFFPSSILTTWDANRFISRGFHLALWKTKPDIVVFLGDLLNDGSVASDADFNSLVQDFRSLMYIPNYVKHTIYVPGDNDIGGEGSDRVTPNKIQRFYSIFNQSTTLQYKFIDFIQVQVMDDVDIKTTTVPHKDGRLRVLLSHIPLLPITRTKAKEDCHICSYAPCWIVCVSHNRVDQLGYAPQDLKVLQQHPSFIFSGHEHESFHFAGTKDKAQAQEFRVLKEERKIWDFDASKDRLHEVTVPTCSYRMGKQQYGYGTAVIEKSGLVHYTVLWLPSRFTQLWLYLISLGIVFLIFLPFLLRVVKNQLVNLCHICGFTLGFGPKYHRV